MLDKKKKLLTKENYLKIDILINTKKDLLRKKVLKEEDIKQINDLDVQINEKCENQEYE